MKSDSSPLGDSQHPGAILSPGDTFGQYQVIRLLGIGGMGQVYEMRHKILETQHAIKLINPLFLEFPGALKFFQKEARVMALIRHEGIVRVDEYGETDGFIWLRQELMEGVETVDGKKLITLKDYLAYYDGSLPQEEVQECMRQFLNALSTAHSMGCVHRDLKPDNVLLNPRGMKIVDFGLVHITRDNKHLKLMKSLAHSSESHSSFAASENAVLGTLEYMSPEQKSGKADERSDLYSVGLIGFQMLTGRKQPGMRNPSELKEGVAPCWDAWLEKALERDVEDRFQSADEMLQALVKLPIDQHDKESSTAIPGDQNEKNIPGKKQDQRTSSKLSLFNLIAIPASLLMSIFILFTIIPDDDSDEYLSLTPSFVNSNSEIGSIIGEFNINMKNNDNDLFYKIIGGKDQNYFSISNNKLILFKPILDKNIDKLKIKVSVSINNRIINESYFYIIVKNTISNQLEKEEEKIEIYLSINKDLDLNLIKVPIIIYEHDNSSYINEIFNNSEDSQIQSGNLRTNDWESFRNDYLNTVFKLLGQGKNYFSGDVTDLNGRCSLRKPDGDMFFIIAKHDNLFWLQEVDSSNERIRLTSNNTLKDSITRFVNLEDLEKRWRANIQKKYPGIRPDETLNQYFNRINTAQEEFPDREPGENDLEYATRVQSLFPSMKPGETYAQWHERKKNEYFYVNPISNNLVPLPFGMNAVEHAEWRQKNFPGFNDESLAQYAVRMIREKGQWGLRLGEPSSDYLNRHMECLGKIEAKKNYSLVLIPGMEMIYCPPGYFTMGSPPSESGRLPDENQHNVSITKGFWLSKHEITQVQFESAIKYYLSVVDDEKPKEWLKEHSVFSGNGLPVDNINWEHSRHFCKLLTLMEKSAGRVHDPGFHYTLPTESQWEYACRAKEWASPQNRFRNKVDATTFGNQIDKSEANFEGISTQPVGLYPSNKWGFHDMHGNVAEWCLDLHGPYPMEPQDQGLLKFKYHTNPRGPLNGSGHVIRGGSWKDNRFGVRTAGRASDQQRPPGRGGIGFRIAYSSE